MQLLAIKRSQFPMLLVFGLLVAVTLPFKGVQSFPMDSAAVPMEVDVPPTTDLVDDFKRQTIDKFRLSIQKPEFDPDLTAS
jgi:hypothetical protein